MLKIDKRLTINVKSGTVTERMARFLELSEKTSTVNTVERLRRFSIGGYLLQELGSGVLDGIISMEDNGELEGLSTAERAQKLVKLLGNVTEVRGQVEAPPAQQPEKPKSQPVEKKAISSIKSSTA